MQSLVSSSADWLSLDGEEGQEEARSELDRRLRQLIEAERLIVLAGLGTSLEITDAGGTVLAPSMSALWAKAEAKVGQERWAASLKSAGWNDEEFGEDIELLLTRVQMALSLSGSHELKSFVSDCEAEIVAACRFIDAETELPIHEAFLRRIARRPARLPRTQLYTTNYDLAFETAASRTGFAVIDGFSHTAPQRFDSGYFDVDLALRDRQRAASAVEWMPNVMQLLKLHGSVDWQETEAGVTRVPVPERPLIVYPRATKFEASYQQPFLEFMAKFQAELRRPDTGVLIVGSGLADRHLVEPLLAAIRSNVRLSLLMVSPNLASSTNPHVCRLVNFVRAGDRRITLLGATFEQLVRLLPDLMPETEAERHLGRTDS
jgi:SIR2-like domain